MTSKLHTKSLDIMFSITSLITICGWAILIVAPDFVLKHGYVIVVVATPLCVAYIYTLFFGRRHEEPVRTGRVSFFSLSGVINLFKSPSAVLAGWVHYMVFDFMVGVMIVYDASTLDISHLFIVPCLLLTLFVGPAGLLGYGLIRLVFVA